MNILHLNTLDTKGGAARVAFAIKEELLKQGCKSSMAVHHKYSNDPNVFVIPQKRSERIKAWLFATDIDFWKSDFILSLDAYKNADIVHIHNIHGNYLSLKTLQKIAEEKPVVWTLHDMWSITGHNSWGYKGYEKKPPFTINKTIPVIETSPTLSWTLGFRDRLLFSEKKVYYEKIKMCIVPVSDWLKNELEGSILANQEIKLIHNGINTGIFYPRDKVSIREKLGLPQDKSIIGFVGVGGANNVQKGWQYTEAAIKSLKESKDVIFICIGAKKPENALEFPNIHYIDYIKDQNTLAEYYSALDIFLFTSIAENFPLVTLEAMACGSHIVCFDVGGTREAVIHEKNGYVAKYKDEDDLIQGIKHILNLSVSEKNMMTKNNINDVATKFNVEVMTEEYMKLYKDLLNL